MTWWVQECDRGVCSTMLLPGVHSLHARRFWFGGCCPVTRMSGFWPVFCKLSCRRWRSGLGQSHHQQTLWWWWSCVAHTPLKESSVDSVEDVVVVGVCLHRKFSHMCSSAPGESVEDWSWGIWMWRMFYLTSPALHGDGGKGRWCIL